MTSMNPITKRIIDFLSHYMELDETGDTAPNTNTTSPPPVSSSNHHHTTTPKRKRQQVSLGIWSGHLSLHQVQLRNDTINALLVQQQQQQHSPRVQLVSGTIGSLDIQIPWQQFWSGRPQTNSRGTKVTLNNVVLVVTLDQWDPHATAMEEEDHDDMDPYDHPPTDTEDTTTNKRRRHQKQRFLHDIERRLQQQELEKQQQQSKKKSHTNTSTTTKQKVDQEARGGPTLPPPPPPHTSISISEYMAQVRQREQQLLQDQRRRQQQQRRSHPSSNPNATDTTTTPTTPANTVLRQKEYWLSTYLKNWTKDLFYTLLVNVSVHIEHFQLVVLLPHYPQQQQHSHHSYPYDPSNSTQQHYMELGCIIPSIQMTNDGGPSPRWSWSPMVPTTQVSHHTVTTAGMVTSRDSRGDPPPEEEEQRDATIVTASPPTTPTGVEKYIHLQQIGTYIRNGTTPTIATTTTNHTRSSHNPFIRGTARYPSMTSSSSPDSVVRPVIPTKDYIIHPFDIDFHGSFRLPSSNTTAAVVVRDTVPLDRKRKSHALLQRATTIDTPMMMTTTTTTASSSTAQSESNPTAKRKRRGKRDKDDTTTPTAAAVLDSTTTTTTKRVVVQDVPMTKTNDNDIHQPKDTSRNSTSIHRHHRRYPTTLGSSPVTTATRRRSWVPLPRHPQSQLLLGRTTPPTTIQEHPMLRRNSTWGRTISSSNENSKDENQEEDTYDDRLPLAQPNDLGAFYLSRKRSNLEDSNSTNTSSAATGRNDNTSNTNGNTINYTELNGSLSISAIHAVCTSTHYKILNDWYATMVKLRNGRPCVSIRTVLRQQSESTSNSTTKLVTDSTVNEPHVYNPQIQEWWRYVYGVIVQELRERKRTRDLFQKMFLSFDWSQQSRYRSEYVKAYIQCRLQPASTKPSSTSNIPRPAVLGIRSVTFGTAPSKSTEERMFVIEDMLQVEQIILYRSIARKIYSKGLTEMPLSFVEVNTNVNTGNDDIDVTHHSIHHIDEANAKAESQLPPSNTTNVLLTLSQMCEITRTRCYSAIGDVLPDHPPELHKQPRPTAITVGEVSKLGLRSDASKTNRTTTSQTDRSYGGVASTAMDHISNSTALDNKNFKMIYTFTVHVQKVELLIIEEELFLKGSQSSGNVLNSSGDSADHDDDTNRSADNISLLTDDDVRSLPIDSTGDWNADVETEVVDPILSSTEYLFFDVPRRVLLQLEMTQLKCSILGDSSTSRCFSFRISQVKAIGDDNLTLVSIGQGNMAPLGEVVISSNSDTVPSVQRRRSSVVTNDALVLSLVISSNHTFLQCDAPTIRAVVDVTTVKKLASFHCVNAVTVPKSLLDIEPRDSVRCFVLKQNKVEFPDLNCSVRIQGCDISLLHEARTGSTDSAVNNMAETLSQTMILNSTVVLRCNIIEMYSGTAVIELSDLMDDWQNYGMLPSESVGIKSKSEPSTVTRRLGMLDLTSLLAESPSMLSFHSVRF